MLRSMSSAARRLPRPIGQHARRRRRSRSRRRSLASCRRYMTNIATMPDRRERDEDHEVGEVEPAVAPSRSRATAPRASATPCHSGSSHAIHWIWRRQLVDREERAREQEQRRDPEAPDRVERGRVALGRHVGRDRRRERERRSASRPGSRAGCPSVGAASNSEDHEAKIEADQRRPGRDPGDLAERDRVRASAASRTSRGSGGSSGTRR